MDWGGEGGVDTTQTKKMVLAQFHIFLKSPMLEKSISFLQKLVSFRKCIQQTGPTYWKHLSVLQNTKVFCHKTLVCFFISLAIVITSARTVIQIVLWKMTSVHIDRPLCHCQRCHHRCHGCRIAADLGCAPDSWRKSVNRHHQEKMWKFEALVYEVPTRRKGVYLL